MTRSGLRIGPRRNPFRWRSPIRGPWLTSMFALPLLIGLPIVIVTGLLDWMAYSPQFGQSIPADVGRLHLPFFEWPTDRPWLFRLTEGLHVGLGLILVPVVLAKLWSVIPKLFTGPPRGPVKALERLSLLLLVGGILFEIVTGLLNIQYDYVFGFSFYLGHFVGAWVFIGAFTLHVLLKLPTMLRSLFSRSLVRELVTPLSRTEPEPPDRHGLVAPDPDAPTMTRRGALGLVYGGALFIGAITAGQTIGGWLRPAALLLPRGRTTAPDGASRTPGFPPGAKPGDANDFPVNRTFRTSGINPVEIGPNWALTLMGGAGQVRFDYDQLNAMPQHTAELPIACVEGWSAVRTWTGVPLRDLARMAGVPRPASAVVRSVEVGPFARAQLTSEQVLAPDSLLALKVNGSPLSRDHGYPARVIVPALPGVHNTKWVVIIEFNRA